ncbi:hypothetical protein SPDO_13140 [Sphingomonas dokdonensis]|uniref:Uncharacterized protein n=2 Tax=Sphingomonas dokdonensis TaxID=344880 RepID=A0A245ZNK5_9SPHN|nr:hypothetical protein SPDO_13140 [Sphingomonas dokdonensis]
MILIVVATLAHGSLFQANFFEAFGAVGQVLFAGAVFWLGWQQFQFTKNFMQRQEKLAAHSIRSELYNKLKPVRFALSTPHTIDTDYVETVWSIYEEIVRIFSHDTGHKVSMLARKINDVSFHAAMFASARKAGDHNEFDALRDKLKALAIEADDLYEEALLAMDDEIDINIYD